VLAEERRQGKNFPGGRCGRGGIWRERSDGGEGCDRRSRCEVGRGGASGTAGTREGADGQGWGPAVQRGQGGGGEDDAGRVGEGVGVGEAWR